MSGSSIYLARELGCDVTGVTLSPVQKTWATTSAAFSGVRRRTRFHCADAEKIEFARRTGMRWLAKLLDRNTRNFLDHFETILNAYRTRAIGYGRFVARK